MSHLGKDAIKGWEVNPPTFDNLNPQVESADVPWPEYPGAESWPARNGFASTRGRSITHITIHAMWGSYEGSLQWFQDPNNPYYTSAHYSVSKSGRVGQSVWERLAAHHVGVHNGYTLGIEHEDNQQMGSAGWVTDKMLHASAKLVAHLCKKYNIPIDRAHIKGHWEYSGQDHTDPGKHWPWDKYMILVRQYAGQKVATDTLFRVKVPAQRIGTFEVQSNAKGLMDSLKNLGLQSSWSVESGMYVVRCAAQQQGAYSTRKAAEAVVSKLGTLGLRSTIEGVTGQPEPPERKIVTVPYVDYNQWYPRPARAIKEIVTEFGVFADTYPYHGTTGMYNGADFWISKLAVRANAEQEALGDEIQKFVEANWVRLGVHYMIYWGWENWGNGWTWYDTSVYLKGNQNPVTQGHFDHIHIQFYS